jgi:hypothetical protein
MLVKDIIVKLDLKVLCGQADSDADISGAYASDLLSDVMGRARHGNAWITMQTHKNIVAVASLKELPLVIIVNGNIPDRDTLESALSENIIIAGTNEGTFRISGRLFKIFEENALV